MPIVEFQPSGKTVEVEAGSEILDAARRAGILIHVPCGGKGTCEKCKVAIVKGTVSGEYITETEVLACKSFLTEEDVTISIPEQPLNLYDRIDSAADFLKQFNNVIATPGLDQLVTFQEAVVTKPDKELVVDDMNRLLQAMDVSKLPHLQIIPFYQKLPQILSDNNLKINYAVYENDDDPVILDIAAAPQKYYGIAIDLGTTSISIYLVDIASSQIIETISGYNDQISCGLDVISRINYAKTDERLIEIQNKVIGSINRLIVKVTEHAGIDKYAILHAYIAGNTIMMHLLCGVHADTVRLEPYVPVFLNTPIMRATDLNIDINQNGILRTSPAIGSYVGGDITAGLLCTEMFTDEDISLFIDIGTNGELVVGNKDFMFACACSAGPAFEGGGIYHGMRATTGAIQKAVIDPASGKTTAVTIGDVEAAGICGSGMIDLIAELHRTGLMDNSGSLQLDKQCDYVEQRGRKGVFYVDEQRKIFVSDLDIGNIMRAKAAIYSAAALLLKHIGIEFKDLKKIYIAGGFGKELNLNNAIAIGLFPDVNRDVYSYLGNTSALGSAMLLTSKEKNVIQQNIIANMTYVDLSYEPNYMDFYTAAMFFPHTDLSQFPSVK